MFYEETTRFIYKETQSLQNKRDLHEGKNTNYRKTVIFKDMKYILSCTQF